MVGVGVTSALLGKQAVWTVPAAFVAAMAVGGIAGLNALTIPRAEAFIAVSLFALGLIIATGGAIASTGRMIPVWGAMIFVMIFGGAHGNAHGLEIPSTANPVAFTVGFLIGTSLLHLAGVVVALASAHRRWMTLMMKLAGIFTAALGVGLLTR